MGDVMCQVSQTLVLRCLLTLQVIATVLQAQLTCIKRIPSCTAPQQLEGADKLEDSHLHCFEAAVA